MRKPADPQTVAKECALGLECLLTQRQRILMIVGPIILFRNIITHFNLDVHFFVLFKYGLISHSYSLVHNANLLNILQMEASYTASGAKHQGRKEPICPHP